MTTTVAALEAFRHSDPEVAEALYALYEQHADSVHAALRRLAAPADADDLLQEVFLVALRRPSAALGAHSSRAWLHGVALKIARASRRKHFWQRLLTLDAARDVAGDDGVRRLEWRNRAHLAAAALAKLSAKKREVFVLFELQGLEGHEIASAMGCSIKTVWSRLAHAREEFLATVARLEREGRR